MPKFPNVAPQFVKPVQGTALTCHKCGKSITSLVKVAPGVYECQRDCR